MDLFNRYGAMYHEPTSDLDQKIHTAAQKYFESLIANGATPTEIRAVAHYFEQSIAQAACETILCFAMKKRKEERMACKSAKSDVQSQDEGEQHDRDKPSNPCS